MSSPPVPGVQFYLIHKKEKVPGVLDVGIQELFLISTEIDSALMIIHFSSA